MPDRPLRILVIADGRSIHTLRFARRLVDRGHEVHIVSDRVGSTDRLAAGIHFHDVQTLDLLTRVRGLRRRWFGRAIANLAARIDADVVHGHGIGPYAYWAAQSGVHPLVVSPWGRDVLLDAHHEPGRTRSRIALEAADWLVVNSAAIEQAAIEAGADRARISHVIWHTQLSGFAPDRGDPVALRRGLDLPADSVIVMSLRNFQARTNIDVLVRAFDAVRRAIPQARLVLAARGGAEREPVERAVRELGLEDLVRFHRVEPEQLPVLVASGDVVVTIADTDSSPSSLLEAMASGRPIVGGWCPSIDEWIRPGEGAEMVECRDVDAVAAALIKLLGDPDLRRAYGDRNAAVVAERVAESGPALELIYRELIAGRTPPPSRLFDAPATAAT